MFEVKITTRFDNTTRTFTIATFESQHGESVSRHEAIQFAKKIDMGYAVDVVNVADEDNAPTFGLVYHRDAEF